MAMLVDDNREAGRAPTSFGARRIRHTRSEYSRRLHFESLEDRRLLADPGNFPDYTAEPIVLTSSLTRHETLSAGDTNDYYQIAAKGGSQLFIGVTGLGANADLELIEDKNNNGQRDPGEVVVGSYSGGTSGELINSTPLVSSLYYIRVFLPSGGSTGYDLVVGGTNAGQPSPDLRPVTGIPKAVRAGESFAITVTAENEGGLGGPDSAINVSVTYADGTDNVIISDPSGISWADYWRNLSPGATIYRRGPTEMVAQDHLIEAGDKNWKVGERNSFSFTITPQKEGTLYIRIRTTMRNGVNFGNDNQWMHNDHSVGGGIDAIDQQAWEVEQYSVAVANNAAILSFSPQVGEVQRGQTATASVEVINTGLAARTFWVGLSLAHESTTNDNWPVGWYDIKPQATSILAHGQTQVVTFSFLVPQNLRGGQFYARSRVWHAFNQSTYIMEGPPSAPLASFYDTLDNPAWRDDDTGRESFWLGPASNPYSDIGSWFAYLSSVSVLPGDIEFSYNDSNNAVKPLLFVGAEVGGTFKGVNVQAEGAFLIDLADLSNLTPEGQSGWVTVWVDATARLGLDAMLFDADLDVDLGITTHAFDYEERALADDRGDIAGGLTVHVPGSVITLAEYSLSEGFTAFPRFELNGEKKVGLAVYGTKSGLLRFEVNKQALADAFRNADDSTLGAFVTSVVETLYGISDQLIRPASYDDGDWVLVDGQWEPNLKLTKTWDNDKKYAHYFAIDVPVGTAQLRVVTNGGTGDADIYVRHNGRPTTTAYDFHSASAGNVENVAITNPAAGRWYIMVPAAAAYDGVNLNASLIAGPNSSVVGDFNNNGVVDAADYVLWRNGGPLANEGGVTPGASTSEDYSTWRSRFGNSAVQILPADGGIGAATSDDDFGSSNANDSVEGESDFPRRTAFDWGLSGYDRVSEIQGSVALLRRASKEGSLFSAATLEEVASMYSLVDLARKESGQRVYGNDGRDKKPIGTDRVHEGTDSLNIVFDTLGSEVPLRKWSAEG
jgi:hypothetical protein